jgi:serine/threonine-protein kinase mTOR
MHLNRHLSMPLILTLSLLSVADFLMDVEYDLDDGTFATQWSIYLRTALHQTDSVAVAEEASKCLGRLCRIYQGTLPRESIDFEVREALEWLNSKDQASSSVQLKKQTAVLILAELLRNVPNLVNVEHVEALIETMAAPLQSSNIGLRIGTIEALRWSLRMIKYRVSDKRTDLYQATFQIAESGFSEKLRSPESMHGSLLGMGVLLTEGGSFMNDKFSRISELVLQLRNHKSDLIRRTIFQLIPKLAKFSPDTFATSYLDTWVSHLVSNAIAKRPERAIALKAIGALAVELGDRIKPQLDKIMAVIGQSFTQRPAGKGPHHIIPEVFECLSSLALAVGSDLDRYVAPLLPHMFASDFNQALVDSLGELAKKVPSVSHRIQDSLLNVLSLILAREPYMSPATASFVGMVKQTAEMQMSGSAAATDDGGAMHRDLLDDDLIAGDGELPSDFVHTSTSSMRIPKTGSGGVPPPPMSGSPSAAGSGASPSTSSRSEPVDVNSKLLALNTLASFDFDAEATKNLIHRVVVNYLEHEIPAVRKKAVIACGKLLRRQSELQLLRGGYAAQMTTYVLQRLMRVSMTDLDPQIRIAAMSSFDKRFDVFLAQPDFLKALFLFLYDEIHEIREIATRMLGRLAKRNPGYIHPNIRTLLLEFIAASSTDTDDIHKKESSAKLLGLTIRKFPKLAKPYIESLVKHFVSIVRANQSPRLCAYSLSALGDLSEVAGEEMITNLDELLPLVIENFQDQSSASRRDSALKALSQIIVNTGYVIEPIVRYPKLLDTVLNKIRREDNAKIRGELIRLLGIMGAIDPYRYKTIQLSLLEDDNEKPQRGAGALPPLPSGGPNNLVMMLVAAGAAYVPGTSNLSVSPSSTIGSNSHLRDDLMKGVSLNSEDYYPAVALSTLIRFLRNPYGSLATYQPMVVQATMTIFKSLGVKSVAYLKYFMPLFMHVMKVCGDSLFGLRELVFQQLCILVSIIKHHARDYLSEFFQMIQEYWDHPRLTQQIVMLIEELATALNDEFRSCLPPLMPKMLQVLAKDQSPNFQATLRILHAFETFGELIDDYLNLIVPAVVQLFTADHHGGAYSLGGSTSSLSLNLSALTNAAKASPSSTPRKIATSKDAAHELKIAAIQCVARLARRHDLTKFAVAIMHPLLRVLDKEGPSLGPPITDALCHLAINLRSDFQVYIRMAHAILSKHGISDSKYNQIIYAIMRGEAPEFPGNGNNIVINPQYPHRPAPSGSDSGSGSPSSVGSPSPSISGGHHNPHQHHHHHSRSGSGPTDEISLNKNVTPKAGFMNSQVLSSAWDTSRCFTKTDWFEWIRKLSIALLSESSSPALRSCAALAKAYYPVARELFNAGFISCWSELPYELQRELTQSLETALSSQNIPPEILQILLDLAEFMEHNEKALPIDIKQLASLATKCHAYAKALYYKETEFRQSHRTTDVVLIEDILSVNFQLQTHEAAQGMLMYAQSTPGIDVKLTWYEKLNKWSIALEAYERMHRERPEDVAALLGSMRCLRDLGSWDQLSHLAAEAWTKHGQGPMRTEIASMALSASLNLLKFDSMDPYVGALAENSLDGSFYRVLLAVHSSNFSEAKKQITQSRELAATELIALIGESYSRAYGVVVRIQQLAELEEIIAYKQSADDPEKRANILELWKKRLQGVERNVEVWQHILSVRSLVAPPNDNIIWWTKFANLVRKSERPRKARKILTTLLVGSNRELGPDEPIPDTFPNVKYSYLNLLYNHPDPGLREIAVAEMERWVHAFEANSQMSNKDKARCIAKLALWQLNSHGDKIEDSAMPKIISTAKVAIDKAPEWYRAWHVWATVNYKFITLFEKQNTRHPKIDAHIQPAITGFVKSVALAPYDNLQDLLRLLTLWFKYGAKKEAEAAMREGFDLIHVDKWLTVIPQLMARIHISLRTVRHGIHNVLTNLGKVHPQALVFPLTVAKQSPFPTRVTAAQSIMTSLRQFSSTLLDETLLVSNELIRVAILWKEKFYKGLDEASRYYYIEKKNDAMSLVLQRLNEILERGPETQSEHAFVKAFGKDLMKAFELTKEFLKTGKVAAINQAWELYGHVFRTIKRQLQTEFDKLHLKNVSPQLLAVKDLNLAVPGTYSANSSLIRIKSFHPVLKVITSKQQPRKLVINGSDGIEYPFLLKGHEDLRQDERVMQLFELVNTFLSLDDRTTKTHLSIRKFAVVPLSPNTGIIEWVPHCDTIHELIKQYRKTHNIPLDAEQLIIMRSIPIPEYYRLAPLQKLEVFEQALEGTSSSDLQRIMFLNSRNSEEWLDKRTTFTRSLAVMSMVGYILGLGDRHPNNLLLNRNSGQIIHIDFGDCFEQAKLRSVHPEKVPFRLTRMLVSAMEVCGHLGTFRITSENVMRVLRSNSDSIVAVLEAFVYDPLLSWRLLSAAFSPSPNEELGDSVGTNPLDQYDEDDDDDDDGDSIADSQRNTAGRDGSLASMSSEVVAGDMHDALNQKALSVIERVLNKLNGLDFKSSKGPLDASSQVTKLLAEATSEENLCQAYLGWCPFW